MKTPKPEKLPSGNWRIRLQIDGKRHSITAATKKGVQEKAKQLYAGAELEKKTELTVGKAMDKYIELKSGVLSPSTILGYQRIRKNLLQELMNVNLNDLKETDVQRAVSAEQRSGKSPKTIRNAHGFLSAVLKMYRPNFQLSTRLPQKDVNDIRIFTEEEMKKVGKQAEGTKYELPILLASWLGLRMSEIKGLKFSDIRDGRIHIQRAVVTGGDGEVVKKTKSTSGDRWIKLPDVIEEMIEVIPRNSEDEFICPLTSAAIYKGFQRICEKAGVEACRFHDLRHFAASEAHSLGVPDKYSMQRMGHKTDNMLKAVYQHTMRDKEDEFGNVIDRRMRDIFRPGENEMEGNEV